MDIGILGLLEAEVIIGTVATELVDIRPGAGEQWEIITLSASHDDNAAARDTRYQIYDGTSTVTLHNVVSLANGVTIYLYEQAHLHSNLIVTRASYLQIRVINIAAGKKTTITAYVRKLKNLPPEA